jgi:glycosyltransferase involved in cell wall biosynthesis
MKLSVAMVAYNHERFIGQAIESVLAQKVNFDYEIVIGEDCCTDGTRAVILDFQRRYPERIVPILRERNIGGHRNIESVLAACRGRYVALLEGDDYWTSMDKLQKQVDFLDTHPDRAMCCHRVRFLNEIGSSEVGVHPLLAAGPYTIEDLLKWNFVVTCSTVVRRDLIRPLPFSLSKVKAGDWARYALVARHGKIELMDEIMATYRLHPEGMWSSMSRATQAKEIVVTLRALEEHLGFQYRDTIRRVIAPPYLDLAIVARSNGKRTETAKHLVSYVRNGGFRLLGNGRLLAGLAAYALIGSWYKVFSRAKSASGE